MEGPHAFIEDRPTCRSVMLGGVYVNLYRLAQEHKLDHGHLWRVVSGRRGASVTYLRKLADYFGMTVDDLCAAIDERKEKLDRREID